MSDLLKINVNDHVEKKNNLSYLSWAWAWSEVLKIDPQAEWEPVEYPQPDGTIALCLYVGEGTALVKTKVTIKGKTRVCLLPVMDHRNKAIKNPDAFAINTAIMRCMTKAISMHGLGLYIYAGEDLPEQDEPVPEKATISATDGAGKYLDQLRKNELEELALDLVTAHKDGHDLRAIAKWYDPDTWSAETGLANDERTYVWHLIKPESQLRTTITANNPRGAGKA